MDPINTLAPRTHPAIAVGTTGSFRGTVKFLCLVTGRILNQREFNRFPMPDNMINRLNAWGKKTKSEIYNNVIKFKDICKNHYHWEYEDDLDGPLDQPKPHETDSIPTDFPGVDFDANEADRTATDKYVSNYNTMAAGASANASIVHGTPHTDVMEGTALSLMSDNNDSIKDMYTPENDPAEIIDSDTDDKNDG